MDPGGAMSEFSIRTKPFRLDWKDCLALSLGLAPFRILPVIGACAGLLSLIGLPFLLKGEPGLHLWVQVLVPGLLIASVAGNLFELRRRYRREPMMHGERIMILNNSAVRVAGHGYDIRQSWSGFHRVRHSRTYIVLHMPGNRVHMLPKRALATPQEATRVVTLARAAIKAARTTPSALPPLPEAPDNRELWISQPFARDRATLCFTRDYVRYTAPTVDYRVDWSNVQGVSRAFRALIVDTPESQLAVPASAFATPAQAMAFYAQAVAFWRAAEARR
jgi:hypothetical protein